MKSHPYAFKRRVWVDTQKWTEQDEQKRGKESVLTEQHSASCPYGEEVPQHNEQFLLHKEKSIAELHHTQSQRMLLVFRVIAHTHTLRPTMDLIHKKRAEQMCKSFINPFLHKLSHKHYSDGISFQKDFSVIIMNTGRLWFPVLIHMGHY